MRQRISYDSSDYSWSVFWWVILIGCIFLFFWWWPTPTYDNTTYETANTCAWGGGFWWWFWIILGILFIWWICTLWYVPVDVSADDDELRIRRPLKTRRIKMDEIESAQPYQVSKKPGKKVFGAAPVRTFGRWGHYRDDSIGDYFAYYGKPENTVLVTLKDGRKYVIGGSDAQALSDYINSKKK